MMIRNHYDEDHEAFRDAFRTFLEREAIPNRARYSADGMVSRELYHRMGEQGVDSC